MSGQQHSFATGAGPYSVATGHDNSTTADRRAVKPVHGPWSRRRAIIPRCRSNRDTYKNNYSPRHAHGSGVSPLLASTSKPRSSASLTADACGGVSK